MATIRLVPSTYAVSNSSYAKVTNPGNMYTNTDSDTYATLQNTRNSTSNTYYVYIRGFNFSSVPDNAVVSSFSVKIKANESYMSTSSSYRMSLYNGTTSISNTTVTSSLSTSVNTYSFPTPSTLKWDTVKGYGANFGIRVPMRRSSTRYSSYIYVYGAEIDVTYTVPVYHSVTITNSTSATVTASESNPPGRNGCDHHVRHVKRDCGKGQWGRCNEPVRPPLRHNGRVHHRKPWIVWICAIKRILCVPEQRRKQDGGCLPHFVRPPGRFHCHVHLY